MTTAWEKSQIFAERKEEIGAHDVARQWLREICKCTDPWMVAAARVSLALSYSSIRKYRTAKTTAELAVSEMQKLIKDAVSCSGLEVGESLPLTYAHALVSFSCNLLLHGQAAAAIPHLQLAVATVADAPIKASTLLCHLSRGAVMKNAHHFLIRACFTAGLVGAAVDSARQWLARMEETKADEQTLLDALELLTMALLKLASSKEEEKVDVVALAEAYLALLRRRSILRESGTPSPLRAMRASQDEARIAYMSNNFSCAESTLVAALQKHLVVSLDSIPGGKAVVGQAHEFLGIVLLRKRQPPQPERAAIHLSEALMRCENGGEATNLAVVRILQFLCSCYTLMGDWDRTMLYAERWKTLAVKCHGRKSPEAKEADKCVRETLRLSTLRGKPASVDAAMIQTTTSIKCNQCSALNGGGIRLSKCGRCGSAQYCSTKCQLAHWPLHKLHCRSAATPSAGPPLQAPAAPPTTPPKALDDPWLD